MSQLLFLRAILAACFLFCLSQWPVAYSQPLAKATDLTTQAENNRTENSKAETALITRTLTDYLEGTAQGDPARLRSAFHPAFNLYAVTDADNLLVRSGEQYIRDIKPGERLNRIGKILSIDLENNAASAKVEIVVPNFRIYTDYFLLLKYQGSWKIVHKSYTWKEIPKHEKKILFVTSNQHTYGKTNINTANHFAEIVVAHDVFVKNGYIVDFVSPKGGAIPLGYIETSDDTQKKYLYNGEFMNALKNTLTPEKINANDYKAVYYSGGGAAMFGVAEHKTIQDISEKIYANGGVVSAICHGTAGIVNLKNREGVSILLNKKITGFPDIFEDTQAAYYKTFPFSIDKEITRQGGNFVYSKKFGDNFYIVDGNIVTGQDPTATASVARKVIELIQKQQ
jgi:putative intracellular protease/amidase